MTSELVSVIVPIYNVKDYLKTCLDSIRAQTYKNIEVWLIDDGSTDGSGEVADKYAKKHKKMFKVIHKENGGLSDARNAGLKMATGKYVTFVDSDDSIHSEFIERIVTRMDNSGAQVGVGDYVRKVISDDNNVSEVVELSVKTDKSSDGDNSLSFNVAQKAGSVEIVTGRQATINTYRSSAHGWSFTTWGKIYRRDLFDRLNLTFPKGKIHEDAYTTYRLLYTAEHVVYINKVLYYYSVRPDSIMTHKLDSRNLDGPPATRGACDFFIETGDDELASMAVNYHCRYLFYLEYWFRKNNSLTNEEQSKLDDDLKEDISRYVVSRYMPLKKRIVYKLAAFSRSKILLNLVKMKT